MIKIPYNLAHSRHDPLHLIGISISTTCSRKVYTSSIVSKHQCRYRGVPTLQRSQLSNTFSAEMAQNVTRDQDDVTARDPENDDVTMETSRKMPRSSVLSDVEIARFGGNSTLQDLSELGSEMEVSLFTVIFDNSRTVLSCYINIFQKLFAPVLLILTNVSK